MQSISVIVPVYNVQNYIERCIESILVQTYTDFELLLVDDGSTDGSKAICTDFARRDKRVSVLDNNHGGVSAARNAGLDAAQGHYITFVDGDDVIHPRFLETLSNAAESYGVDIAVANYKKIRHVGTVSVFGENENEMLEKTPVLMSEDQVMEKLFDDVGFMTVWGKLYKRACIGNHRFLNLDFAEDIEFNSRVFLNGGDAAFVDAPLYAWISHPDSAVGSVFSREKIDNVKSYLRTYYNVAPRGERYAGFALKRLYKGILSVKYNANKKYAAEINEVNKAAVKETRREFLKNKYVGIGFKAMAMMFVYVPFMYALFRFSMSTSSACKRNSLWP